MCEAACPREVLKFRDPCLNHSRQIPPEAIGCGIFDSFFDRKKDNYVISGYPLCECGCRCSLKLGDSRSTGSRNIQRLISCRTNEPNEHCRSPSQSGETPVRCCAQKFASTANTAILQRGPCCKPNSDCLSTVFAARRSDSF